MMTTPAPAQPRWSTQGLQRLATSFVAQEHVGIFGGLLLRLARFLQGDPTLYLSVVSAGGAQVGLPDNTPAATAVLVVTGTPILFRLDGGQLLAADAQLPVGAVITLTGTPTIKGFRFASVTSGTATLVGSYFD